MHPHMSDLTLIAAGDEFCIILHPKPELQAQEGEWWRGVCAIERLGNQRL